MARHYSRILCVRHAPSGLTDYRFRLSLATDLVVALRSSGALPNGYYTFIGAAGGDRPGFVDETCDPAKHPIIIDYATGTIESINPEAMTAVAVYDMEI